MGSKKERWMRLNELARTSALFRVVFVAFGTLTVVWLFVWITGMERGKSSTQVTAEELGGQYAIAICVKPERTPEGGEITARLIWGVYNQSLLVLRRVGNEYCDTVVGWTHGMVRLAFVEMYDAPVKYGIKKMRVRYVRPGANVVSEYAVPGVGKIGRFEFEVAVGDRKEIITIGKVPKDGPSLLPGKDEFPMEDKLGEAEAEPPPVYETPGDLEAEAGGRDTIWHKAPDNCFRLDDELSIIACLDEHDKDIRTRRKRACLRLKSAFDDMPKVVSKKLIVEMPESCEPFLPMESTRERGGVSGGHFEELHKDEAPTKSQEEPEKEGAR